MISLERLRLQTDDQLDFAAGPQGEAADPNRAAAVDPRVPKELPQQLGGAVDHLGLGLKIRGAVDIPHYLDDSFHPVQAAGQAGS